MENRLEIGTFAILDLITVIKQLFGIEKDYLLAPNSYSLLQITSSELHLYSWN
jgi:hypothetical protein